MNMQPENLPVSSDFYQLITGEQFGSYQQYGCFPSTTSCYDYDGGVLAAAAGGGDPSFCGSSSFYPFENSDITDLPSQAKALAASKTHREAEKRRRERINSHLNRLRSLLPCTSKTDKASLLAKVIHHVKELKQQAMEISERELFPSETDEITVLSLDLSSEGRKSVLKASLCCEDRSDLLPDLIETLKSLRLKTLRAEMATLGGRIRNVLIVTGEEDDDQCNESIGFLREALTNLVDRSSSCDRSKRRRIFDRRAT
ncbi:hypothetical protein AQUCO_00400748v1 [Aquilegia coerulea]|uniref:BHLH domain-containing protein n=1 Tax=Aquilegia coerulea TaxID=218851 RepID=A0A2G5EWH4_AQUCA|nr:hypothetical protein AQUCO_00400748v1 [Aquilegia coerulea]